MRKNRIYFLLIVATVAVCAAFLPGCRRKNPPAAPTGQTRTGTQNPTLQAEFIKQYDLQGKVAIIEFGMVGCSMSDEGLDNMISMQNEGYVPGLSYIRVEESENSQAIDEYYSEKQIPFPVHHDPLGKLAAAFDATMYPGFVIVGKYGRIRYIGKFPEEHLTEWAELLLEEEKDPGANVALFGLSPEKFAALYTKTKLPNIDGQTKSLSQYAGPNGVLLVFVKTDCPFAQSAVDDMKLVSPALEEYDIPTVLINIEEDSQTVVDFYISKRTAETVVYDETGKTSNDWNIHSVPTLVYFDAQGNLSYLGKAVWADFALAVENILGLSDGAIQFTPKGTEYG